MGVEYNRERIETAMLTYSTSTQFQAQVRVPGFFSGAVWQPRTDQFDARVLADKLKECPQICFTLLFQAFYENNFVEKGQLGAYKQELEAKVCRHDSRQLA